MADGTVAADGLYVFNLAEHVGAHEGLVNDGDVVESVFVLDGGPAPGPAHRSHRHAEVAAGTSRAYHRAVQRQEVFVSYRFIVAGLAASVVVSFSQPSQAADRRLDPKIARALRSSVVQPWGVPQLVPGRAGVLVELSKNVTASSLERLRQTGAQLSLVDGRVLYYRRFIPISVDQASLDKLLALSDVRRVSLSPPPGPRPLDHSADLLGLAAARGARPNLDLLTGKGTVVADLDGNADVYHPQFFQADAGYFDWIDQNNDGKFTPGDDAIDLDRDGQGSAAETAEVVRAETLYTYYGSPVPARGASFDPGIDWLYLDENGSGKREYGAENGFNDFVPAFGEPLFVPDDLNRNGKLDIGERVVRLGTSKFKKVFVRIDYYADVNHVFERGVDLTTHKGVYISEQDAFHGSAVLSIVAGDVPLVGRKWVGMAPDAELLLGYAVSNEPLVGVVWALGERPDVVLHETANWFGEALDGSDPYSTLVDESTAEDNISHSCPVGNLGGSRKHARVELAPGQTKTMTFELPDKIDGTAPYYVELSLSFRGSTNVSAKLTEPGGESYDFAGQPYGALSTGANYYITRQTTSAGTRFLDALLYTDPGQTGTKPIPGGLWTLEVTGAPDATVVLHGYLADDLSSWGVGVAWEESLASDDSTIGIPAVSDSCIAVGAHTGHPAGPGEYWYYNPEAQPEVRAYSGRGPRIDGALRPDVLAPDNPWVAAPEGTSAGTSIPHGAVWPFGGTSGAGPHVAGAAALFAQAGIRGDDVRTALRASAFVDGHTGAVPNNTYGHGRLNIAKAFGVESAGLPPTISLEAPAQLASGVPAEIAVNVTDPDGPAASLQVRWDDGYDGTWDTDYGPAVTREVVQPVSGRYAYKARARDAQGRVAEAVVWLKVADGPIDAGLEDASPDASTGALPATEGEASSDEGGCGCRIPARHGSSAAHLAAAVALGAALMRRLRRSRA